MVRTLWTKVLEWLSRKTGKRIEVSTENILLGNKEYNYITNYVIIVTKNEIYRRKWKHNIPTLRDIKLKLKKYMEIEIYIGTTNDMLEKTLGEMVTHIQRPEIDVFNFLLHNLRMIAVKNCFTMDMV